jgi:multidrug efflux pump subunit AcrA (membrane-fusion protein)
MKTKLILLALLVLAVSGAVWMTKHRSPASTAAAGDRKVLYYTCAMHPWVKEHEPGPCPVCSMNLTPVYENDGAAVAETSFSSTNSGTVTLEPESISTINVQTDLVERRPVRRTIHLAGEITWNSATAAWFEFTVYERDLQWLKIGQTLEIVVTSVPDKTFTAEIKAHGVKSFADADFDMMTGSTKVRAEISNPPVQPGDFGKYKWFDNLHAEAHTVAETEAVLTVPRSAVISRGTGPMVYVEKGGGHYEPRQVQLGRIGDELAEVLGGLEADEKVVTTGNLLIDSEAQLTASQ